MNNSKGDNMTKQEWLEKNAGRFMVSDDEDITFPDEDKKEEE